MEVEENAESIVFMCGGDNFIDDDCEKITFLIDSGATDHVTNRADLFTTEELLEKPITITVAKKDVSVQATKKGNVDILTNTGVTGTLENVLYSPDVPYNLLSVRRMQKSGMNVLFHTNGQVQITKGDKIIATGKSNHNLISVVFTLNKNIINQAEAKNNLYKLWHARLGHLSKTKFLEIKRNDIFINNKKLENITPIDEICEACVSAKQACLPFSKSKDKTYVSRPLFIIHTDVCGPITPSSIDDKNYFVTFIDQFTHYTVVYLLNRKSDVFVHFQDFVRKSETHHNLRVAHLYCDNGREYLSNEFKQFCIEKGIQYHFTVPYTPQQNSVAERMNRSLVEKARSLIHGANLTKALWGEAILTATYLINLTPTKALEQNKTPYELWHHRKPRLDHLRIFGSTVYIHDKTRKHKFDEKCFKGILVGYQANGYKILIAHSNKFIVARDVIFDEINFNISRPSLESDEIQSSSFKKQKIDHKIELNDKNENKIDELGTDNDKEEHDIQVDNDSESKKVDKGLSDCINHKTNANENLLRRSARIQKQ